MKLQKKKKPYFKFEAQPLSQKLCDKDNAATFCSNFQTELTH